MTAKKPVAKYRLHAAIMLLYIVQKTTFTKA